MDLTEYQQYLKTKVSFWEKNEQADIEEKYREAAYRARIIRDAYYDALQQSMKIDSL